MTQIRLNPDCFGSKLDWYRPIFNKSTKAPHYFTEMSKIALAHGGTVDKFIGDAMLIFFGDPETKGIAEDARACVGMAFDLQRRVAELNVRWRKQGIEQPFRVRMGVNTGFCNVHFGSSDRTDYTIIGAEANLAARLQAIAEPGQIVLSYETYALVRDMVTVRKLQPILMKGIGHPVIPYMVDSLSGRASNEYKLFSEHGPRFDLYLDPSRIGKEARERARSLLHQAIAELDGKTANESNS